jgi:hypothetical protein
MATKFETETCSRCGGTGTFSYCARYGRTCFKCRGTGVTLTKRGAAAKARYETLLSRPFGEVQVGDFVFAGFPEMGKAIKWRRVLSIEPDRFNDGYSLAKLTGDYELNYCVSTPVKSISTEAQRQAALEQALQYQETLTKAGKPARKAASACC